jgi:hypothetical protein
VRRLRGRGMAVGSILTLGALTLGAAILSVTTAPRLVVGTKSWTTEHPWVPHPLRPTPPGWVPVAFGPVQVSVPSSWFVVRDGAAECSTAAVPGVLLLDWTEKALWCPSGMGQVFPGTSIVALSRLKHPVSLDATNGAYGSSLSVRLPSLGIEYSAIGGAVPQVLQTIGYSARTNVHAPGSGPAVPASWRRVTFSGLSLAVPRHWPIERPFRGQRCVGLGAQPSLILVGQPIVPGSCGGPLLHPVPPVNGIEVDAWHGSYLGGSDCETRHQAGLRLCIDQSSPGSVLFVKVTDPDGQTFGVQIGLAGDGQIARTLLATLSG